MLRVPMMETWERFHLGSFSPLARPLNVRMLKPRTLSHPSHPAQKFSRDVQVDMPNLPLIDLAEPVVEHLMRSCGAAAARCAPTCHEFAAALQRVAQRLLDEEGIAYWTGNKPPLKPPVLYGVVGSREEDWRQVSDRDFVHLVRGAGLSDVLKLHRAQWATNFTVALAVQVAHLQLQTGEQSVLIHDIAPVLSLPRLLPYTLGACIRISGGAASFAAHHASWHAQLAAAPYVVCAVNSGNAHWASMRVWKEGPAQVFDSMPGSTGEADVQIILDLLVCLGWDSGKQIDYYSFNHYRQHDGHSCGLITAATLVSLLHNHQLGVASSDLTLWKDYFTHSMYCATHTGTPLMVRTAAHPNPCSCHLISSACAPHFCVLWGSDVQGSLELE